MFRNIPLRRPGKSEGEKPFWISYADLMTALMVLCLVAMAVAIIAITRQLERVLSEEERRAQDIREICQEIKVAGQAIPGVSVNCSDQRIDFGSVGRFANNDYRLDKAASPTLGKLVPVILEAANSDKGKKWLKQVVIEGHTSTRGSYLYNLNLSLQRSYWVMCKLVDGRMSQEIGMTGVQAQQVRELFLAGGVSFNDARASDEDSRRVEFRLQFYTQEERAQGAVRLSISSEITDRCELE
jgi:outer membrane protein OmpA-like peptidoglycan-associated protein